MCVILAGVPPGSIVATRDSWQVCHVAQHVFQCKLHAKEAQYLLLWRSYPQSLCWADLRAEHLWSVIVSCKLANVCPETQEQKGGGVQATYCHNLVSVRCFQMCIWLCRMET